MVTLEYIQDNSLPEDYINLLKIGYPDSYQEKLQRMEWYKNNFEYRILLARLDGVPVGQSCAYKVNGMLSNSDIDVWWGVDSFVFMSARGNGVGKKMQQKLHEDLPNFSSVWYSPTNGHIKKKCGARELADLKFCYYPISRFLIPFSFLVSKKLFGKGFYPNVRLPFFYSTINGIGCNRTNKFSFREVDITLLDDSFYSCIESFLEGKDFYVKRDKEYFTLKYGVEHGLNYHAFAIYDDDEMEAFFAFTELKDMHWVLAPIKGVKVLDSIIKSGSSLTQKDIFLFIAKYYKSRKQEIDGILSLQDARYFPKYAYPHPSTPFLSMIDSDKLENVYVSYIDQDMEY